MFKPQKGNKKVVEFSVPGANQIYKQIEASLAKRNYDKHLVQEHKNAKGFYETPVTNSFIWEMYNRSPRYTFNSILILRLLPFLKPLVRKIIYILWRFDSALNKNRHQAFSLLINTMNHKDLEKGNK